MSEQQGWGGNTQRLHWIRGGAAICGQILQQPEVENMADLNHPETTVREHACRKCRAKLVGGFAVLAALEPRDPEGK